MDSLYQTLQRPLSEKEADYVLELRDANRDGVLDKKELMSDLRHKNTKPKPTKMRFTREQIKEIFLEHDIDGDGFLSVGEMTKAFGFLGSILPFYKAHYCLAYADQDGDDLISEAELDKLIDYVEKTNRRSLN